MHKNKLTEITVTFPRLFKSKNEEFIKYSMAEAVINQNGKPMSKEVFKELIIDFLKGSISSWTIKSKDNNTPEKRPINSKNKEAYFFKGFILTKVSS